MSEIAGQRMDKKRKSNWVVAQKKRDMFTGRASQTRYLTLGRLIRARNTCGTLVASGSLRVVTYRSQQHSTTQHTSPKNQEEETNAIQYMHENQNMRSPKERRISLSETAA
jgi:hypothetical protein